MEHIESNTSTDRQIILTQNKGFRIRLVRINVQQSISDGRHLWELYFGAAGNMIAGQNKVIDIRAIPDGGSDSTRTFLRNQGPRGLRDEVLSGRWRGAGPANAHKIIIEYTEES